MPQTAESQVRAPTQEGAAAAPAELVRQLESLGPVFRRIGHYLALRPDLISPQHRDALLLLEDRSAPSPWQAVRQILGEDLGGDPERYFSRINPQPLLSATLAQVHLGRTHDGREVAIKVQREGIREQIRQDLGRGRQIARILELAGAGREVALKDIVEELRCQLEEELDLERELRNLSRMAEAPAGQFVLIPRPCPELSGKRVLVHEHLAGVAVSDLLPRVRAGGPGVAAELGLDLEVVVNHLIRTILAQIFERHFFNADTHPDNLVFFPDNAVGFVDFGLVGRLDESVPEGQLRYVSAVFTGSAQEMHHAASAILGRDEHSDTEGFRHDFFAAARTWLTERDEDEPAPELERSPVASFMTEVLRAARRHRMPLSQSMLAMNRALICAETVAFELAPAADLRRTRERLFSRLLLRRALEGLRQEQVGVDLLALIKDGPGQLQRLLSDLEDERFTLPVRISESIDERAEANIRARMISAAILSVSFSYLLVGFGDRAAFGFLPLSGVFAAALGAAFLLVGLLWRRLL